MAPRNVTLFAKLSLDYADHPKIQALSDVAFRLHVELMLYCRKYLTDGRVPNRVANRLGSDAVTELLTNSDDNPSLTQNADGSYQLYGYDDIQETKADVDARRLVNATNGRRGGRPAKRTETQSVTDPVSHPRTAPGSEKKAETETETETETRAKTCATPDSDNLPALIDSPVADAPAKREPTTKAFDEWYTHYPKKKNRGDAVKAFPKALKRIPLSELIEATQRFAADPGEYQFIPYPASWLNAEGWADQPPTAQQVASRKRPATLGETDWAAKMAAAELIDAQNETRRTA